MLKITIPAIELYDEKIQEFLTSKSYELQLEHSLVSISKWESKWHKPFLTKGNKPMKETIDYIRCMTISQNVDDNVYSVLRDKELSTIMEYIDDSMTATIFQKETQVTNKETITSELIYYWMIAFNIPSEYQRWHLNRLLTLINVCNIKNQPKKKLGRKELMERNRSLNEQRKAKLNTKG